MRIEVSVSNLNWSVRDAGDRISLWFFMTVKSVNLSDENTEWLEEQKNMSATVNEALELYREMMSKSKREQLEERLDELVSEKKERQAEVAELNEEIEGLKERLAEMEEEEAKVVSIAKEVIQEIVATPSENSKRREHLVTERLTTDCQISADAASDLVQYVKPHSFDESPESLPEDTKEMLQEEGIPLDALRNEFLREEDVSKSEEQRAEELAKKLTTREETAIEEWFDER